MPTELIRSHAKTQGGVWPNLSKAVSKFVAVERNRAKAEFHAAEMAELSEDQLRDAGIDPLSLVTGPVLTVEPGLMNRLMSMR